MEAFDKDEGYISPLDAFDAGEVENNCLKYNQLVKQPIKPYLSWSNVQKPFREKNQQDCQTMPLKFLTDNVLDSAKIIDSLWLVLPEIRAGRNWNPNTLTEIRSTNNNPSGILNVVESVSQPEYLSLSDFIRDVIDLLSGKQSETFPMLNDKIFSKNPAVLVRGLTPSAISNYCTPFLRIGSLIIELNNIEESFHFHTSVLSAKSVVCVRFVKFIKDYLHVYQTIIMLKRASIVSLTSLRRFIQPYQQQIQTLWNIVQKQVFASPVLMLKNLNSFMLKIEIPCVSELLQNLLVSCASAYSKYVSDWIFRGLLGSPLEFHIVKSRTVASKDRRFWTQQFTQNQDIPKFLKRLKQGMFDTGRAINLLKELQRTSNLPSYFDYDTDLYIEFELTHEGTIKLLNTNHTKLVKFLEQNAYLQEEINLAVEAVQTLNVKGKLVEAIHSKLVERNEVECALRLETARQEKFLKFQEKRQSQMAEILESINAARLLRLQQAMDELFAEKERQAYNEKKERVNLNKGYSLLQQFYGDFSGIIKHNINSSGEGLRQQITSSVVAKSNVIASAGDCDMNSDDSCSKKKDIEDSNISLAHPSEKALSVPATENQSDPSSIYPCDNSGVLPVEIPNEDEIPDSAPTDFEKIRCKDFKTKPVTPFSLDFKMFSPPLVPTVIPNSGEFITCGGEECDEFLTNRFLSLSVEIPLMTQHKMVNLTLLHHIVVSKQLFRHLKAFHDYLLLQNGLFGYFVNTMLIDRVKKGILKHREEIPNQITALNHLLEEVLTAVADPDEMSFLKSMKFDVIPEVTSSERDKLSASSRSSSSTTLAGTPGKPKKQELTSEFEVLNSIYLHYTVEWPLNIIFTNEFIRQYQLVFCLQMRLFRAELLLSGAAVSLKSKSCRSTQLLQLNSYRYIMLHFVQSARSYINVTVIHTSWTELVASFTKMDSLEKIYELLVRHIKSVTSNCLLGPKAQAVMKLLVNQLVVIEAFCCKLETVMNNINWDKGETIQPVDYKRIVQSYRVFMEIQKVFVQGKVINQEKVEFMKQIARDIGITFSEPDPNMPVSVVCDLQLKLLESIIHLDSSNNSRTPRKKKARKYLKSSLESKESRKIEALQICPNLQDLADNISCLSVQELLSASEKLIRKNSPNCIQNYITGERKWLVKCLDEGFSAEEDILRFRRQALQRLYCFLLVPFPKYILSQPKLLVSRSHYEIGSKRSTEIEAGEVIQKIAQKKDQILSSGYGDVCHRISIIEQANVGAAEFLNTIEQNENNDSEDVLEQNEHDLRNTEEDLLKQIKEILIILCKEGRLARRSIPVIYNLICKLRVEEGDVEKLDPHVISLLVSQLHILRVESSGKSGKLRLVFNDFIS